MFKIFNDFIQENIKVYLYFSMKKFSYKKLYSSD